MSLIITDDCINCDVCEPECPNAARSNPKPVGAAEGCDLLTLKDQKIAAFGSSYADNHQARQVRVVKPYQ